SLGRHRAITKPGDERCVVTPDGGLAKPASLDDPAEGIQMRRALLDLTCVHERRVDRGPNCGGIACLGTRDGDALRGERVASEIRVTDPDAVSSKGPLEGANA